jgi:hypothetical protein
MCYLKFFSNIKQGTFASISLNILLMDVPEDDFSDVRLLREFIMHFDYKNWMCLSLPSQAAIFHFTMNQ